MNCPQCGSQIPEGKLYCPKCGYEVHLVPDYTSLSMERDRLLRAQAEEKLRLMEEAELEEQKNRTAPSVIIMKTFLILVLAVLFAAPMVLSIARGRSGSFTVLKQEALSAYEQGRTEEARGYCEEALLLHSRSTELRVLKSRLLLEEGDREAAEALLYEVIASDHDALSAYELLINLLLKEDRVSEASELIRRGGFEKLMELYGSYLADPPVFSLINGNTYPLGTKLTIEGSGRIFYTTDGSEPDEHSIAYTEPILLEAGTNRISAVSINEHGVSSKIVKAVYTVRKAS